MSYLPVLFVVLVILKFLAEQILSTMNRLHVAQHKTRRPDALKDIIDQETYEKAADYTLAKSKFGAISNCWETTWLLITGLVILPALYNWFSGSLGTSIWMQPLVFLIITTLISIPNLPWEWWEQFKIEARFGFNKSTLGLWISDQLKSTLINGVLMYPLLLALIWLVSTSSLWWLWGYLLTMGFMLLMMVIGPMFIMPLFNKFTPLADGSLKDRLNSLAQRTSFPSKTILVMDGSRRSAHSNAFFAGFGKARRIVLFDTLIEQLTEEELEAVLAHEIGHYKKKHLQKMLLVSSIFGFLAFWLLGQLAASPAFAGAFGYIFGEGELAPTLLVFSMFAPLVVFWLTPIFSARSRKHEYEADAYAKASIGTPAPLIGALRKLQQKNLSNFTPHPLYSRVYYSHPTLLEREAALNLS